MATVTPTAAANHYVDRRSHRRGGDRSARQPVAGGITMSWSGSCCEAGSAMPVDSLDLMDILVEFRQRTGLRIPKRKLRRRDMRSVRAFSKFAAREGRP